MACWTEVQHSRPGQRRVVNRLVCSVVESWLVVRQLSSRRPERSLLPQLRQPHNIVRCGVAYLEGLPLLAKIHSNEVKTVSYVK